MPHPMPTDPEVLAYIARSDAFYPADSARRSIAENRAFYDAYALEMRGAPPAGVTSADGSLGGVPARWFYAHGGRPEAPVVLYLHGGGYVLGGLESHHDACAGLCERTGLDVVVIAYRLAPEHRHPAQLDDCEAAFLAMAALGRQVLVAGDSAGGNLAAGLCLRRRRLGAPRPIAQVLIYPGLGGDRAAGSYVENADAPMLTAKDSLAYNAARFGDTAPAIPAEAMPLRADDVSGLPPAAIVTADLDPLRDDGPAYAAALNAAGVPAIVRNEPQLVHGYLRARHMSARAGLSFAWICDEVARLAAP